MWTPEREKWMLNLSRTCRNKSQLHEKAARYFAWYSKALGIPTVCTSALTTLSIFEDWSTNESSDGQRWFTAIVSSSALILTSLSTFMQADRKRDIHTNIAARYREISMDIDEILTTPANSRMGSKEFGSQIKIRMNQLNGTALLPNYVLSSDRFAAKLEEESAELEEIVIHQTRAIQTPAAGVTRHEIIESLAAHGSEVKQDTS